MKFLEYSIVAVLVLAVVIACEEQTPTMSPPPTPVLVENCRISDDKTSEVLESTGDIIIGVAFAGACSYAGQPQKSVAIVQTTSREYGTTSLTVLNKIELSSANIDITIKGIQVPIGPKNGEIGPVFTITRFDMEDGNYALNLIRGTQTDAYQLIVADTGITLSAITTSFTQLGASFAAK